MASRSGQQNTTQASQNMAEHQSGAVSPPLRPVEATLRTDDKVWRWFTAASETTGRSGQAEERGQEAERRAGVCEERIYFQQTEGDCGKTNQVSSTLFMPLELPTSKDDML